MVIVGIAAAGFGSATLRIQYSMNMQLATESMCYSLERDFTTIETICEAVANIAYSDMPDDVDTLAEDSALMDEYISTQISHAENVVEEYDSDFTIFLRFNPEYFGNTAGYYLTRVSNTEYKYLNMVDFDEYDEGDIQVEWFYKAINNESGIWLFNYEDPLDSHTSTSYITPIFKEGRAIAVFGMEVDAFDILASMYEIQNYETGVSLLLNSDNSLIYYYDDNGIMDEYTSDEIATKIKDYLAEKKDSDLINTQLNVDIDGSKYLVQAMKLENGMTLINLVKKGEIYKSLTYLIMEILIIALAIGALAVFVTSSNTRKIVKPLEKLTEVAVEIANSNYNVRADEEGDKEIRILAHAINKATIELSESTEYMKRMAYMDALTGLKNKRAFFDEGAEIAKGLLLKTISDFAAVYFDVNNLKYVNDNLGHEEGDMLLIDAATLIKLSFGDLTFRTGGDEFVAFLLDENVSGVEEMVSEFMHSLEEHNKMPKHYGTLIVAVGCARYQAHDTYTSVVTRAEEAMYKNKHELKGENLS